MLQSSFLSLHLQRITMYNNKILNQLQQWYFFHLHIEISNRRFITNNTKVQHCKPLARTCNLKSHFILNKSSVLIHCHFKSYLLLYYYLIKDCCKINFLSNLTLKGPLYTCLMRIQDKRILFSDTPVPWSFLKNYQPLIKGINEIQYGH